ncbi:TnpV protein [Neglectibacter caecimuris]|uniref:TnpV protein n=1 Tax=Neglectibacter caecimuris TaxID=3093658 RepID=UPI002AC9D87A|nr:TnpV protein [Neglectibacter sp. M00184]
MSELKPRIHDEVNGLDYVLAVDYYIPAIELPWVDDRPIGKWGRMHRAYLEKTNPLLLNHLILMGKLHSYLADLNEQAQNRCQLIVKQMAATEGVTEDLKRRSQWEWIKAMNSIVGRAEEIIRSEIINA